MSTREQDDESVSEDQPSVADELFAILQERDMPAYPEAAKAAGVGYTDYLTGAHSHTFATDPETGKNYIYTPSRNRQCSIGYHGECTDPDGDRCGCPCHPILKLLAAQKATT